MSSNAETSQEQDDLVYYCRHCHSLLILVNEDLATSWWDGSYCGKCNGTDIGQCTIDEWMAEEERREKRRNERNK